MGRVVEVFSRMYKIPAVYGGSEEGPGTSTWHWTLTDKR